MQTCCHYIYTYCVTSPERNRSLIDPRRQGLLHLSLISPQSVICAPSACAGHDCAADNADAHVCRGCHTCVGAAGQAECKCALKLLKCTVQTETSNTFAQASAIMQG